MRGYPVIEVQDVSFSFNGTNVLKDVNLTIRSGDFVAMIGPNGGGKTTLIKLILGILLPDRGQIRILGRPPKQVVSRMGYVPQDIHVNRGFPISAQDVVLMGRMRGGPGWRRTSDADRKILKKALEGVSM